MQGTSDGAVHAESGGWLLDFGALRLLDNHVRAGKLEACQEECCRTGLQGAISPVEVKVADGEKPGVVEGDGADEGGDSASPPDHRGDSRYLDY